jgi:hypothetical protein
MHGRPLCLSNSASAVSCCCHVRSCLLAIFHTKCVGVLVHLVIPSGRETGHSSLTTKEHKNAFTSLPYTLSWRSVSFSNGAHFAFTSVPRY